MMEDNIKRVERLEEIASVHDRLNAIEHSLGKSEMLGQWWRSPVYVSALAALLAIVPRLLLVLRSGLLGGKN